MSTKFLDKDGLTYLWTKIKTYIDKKHILDSKTFTNVIGTANNWADATFFYGKIQPINYYANWEIKYRMYIEAAGRNDCKAISQVTISGTRDTYTTYACYNSIANTSYRPAYYHELYRAKEAGIINHYGHALGLRLYSSWNAYTAANTRTVKVEILSTINCDFTFFDNMTKYANIPGTGSTNYSTYSEFDFVYNGLREVGDDNTLPNQLYYTYAQMRVGDNGMYQYTLAMHTPDEHVESIVTNSTTGIKTINPHGFMIKDLFYYSGGNNTTKDAVLGTTTYYTCANLIDARYIWNGVTTSDSTSSLIAHKPLYLVGTIKNSLFYLDKDKWIIQDLPKEYDGKAYMHIGDMYDCYRYVLFVNNPIYMYKDGMYRLYNQDKIISKNSVPYLMRKTGGDLSRIGEREDDTLVGATVSVNQLIPEMDATEQSKFRYFSTSSYVIDNGMISIKPNGNYSSMLHYGIGVYDGVPVVGDHTYYVSFKAKSTKADKYRARLSTAFVWTDSTIANTWASASSIVKATDGDNTTTIYANDDTLYTSSDTIDFKEFVVIDLTAYFGSTIADYLYNLETATAGAGIAKLREWGFFTGEYIPYNPGSLESVEARSHVMRGFNQWDEEWELGTYINATGVKYPYSTKIRNINPVRVLPNTQYYYHVGTTSADEDRIWFYDADMTFISSVSLNHQTSINQQFTTPSNCSFINFSINNTTYNNDICINLSSDRNGEYEAYSSHTYDLGEDTLRGLFKLDANNNLYADGDTKASDGTVTRRYPKIDLGTLNWTFNNDSCWNCFISNVDKKNGINNILCDTYPCGIAYGTTTDKIISGNPNSKNIYIRDSSFNGDAAAFKTAMDGVMLVYEAVTPTTEQSTPFTNPQICDPDGTEEYVTSNGIPVGHETEYFQVTESTIVNGHTVDSDVPANAKFTDTTYESKPAASGGTDLSLVTTGDKYRWNTAAASGGDVNIIESVKVNGTALTPDANKTVNVILPSNLLNGSATGSLRSIGSQAENSSYTIGTNSLALGIGTLTASQTQIALGKYNVSDSSNTYAVIIGNGTANNARSNALTIDWNGNVSIGNSSKTSTYSIRAYNSLHDINLNANTSGNAGIWDSTTSSWMIYNDTNGKTYLGNSTQIYTDGSSLRANTFYTSYNIYCGSAIGTGGRTSYTDVSKSGDWISSDGVIDLVRSDTSGGLIQFHYNYSSSVTSTIEEINSGVIHISGTLTTRQAIRSNASSTDYCKLNGHTAMAVGQSESRIGAFISSRNSTEDLANNNIYLYANSQGRVGIYSIREDTTAVTILSRENNTNTITFGNSAGNVLTYSYNYSSAPPIVSNTTANHRVSHFYMSSATQLMVYAQGNASSYAAYYISTSSSDIRLKENIQDTKVSALPVINSFKMREFDWKNGDGHQDIGMIADEIEKIDPKLAIGGGYDENGEMNIKTIDTFYLIGYLTKAVQELSAEIEELKK